MCRLIEQVQTTDPIPFKNICMCYSNRMFVFPQILIQFHCNYIFVHFDGEVFYLSV